MRATILILFTVLLSVSVEASLKLHYQLDEGSGNTAGSSVNQSSGSDLTLSNADWDLGLYGSAVKFTTTSGVADAGDPQSWVMSGDLTLACWVYITGGGSSSPLLVGTDSDTAHGWRQHYMIRMTASSRVPRLFIRDKDADTLDLASPSAVPLNTWTHLAITFDYSATEGVLYVNGTEVNRNSGFTGNGFSGWDASTIVKAGIGNAGASMHGLYDDLRLYDEVLDAVAISALASRKEVIITETDNSTKVAEGGVGGNPASDTFTVTLSKQPSDDVTVTLSEQVGNGNDLVVSPDTLVFTSQDWAARTVTVTAIDDSDIENDPEVSNIEFSVSSSDPGYDGVSMSPVIVSVMENDCGAWGYHAADLDMDCHVGLGDFAEFALQWLSAVFPNKADFNEDNQVNILDLAALTPQWLGCSCPNEPDCTRPRPSKPNIILFLVDDLGWNDSSVPMHTERTVWNDIYYTPNLEGLAEKGMRFSNAYAAHPVCSPTRTSIITGKNPARTRITSWVGHGMPSNSYLNSPSWTKNGLQPGDGNITLPTILRDNGYRTVHIGKAHFGNNDGANPENLGFDLNIAGSHGGGPWGGWISPWLGQYSHMYPNMYDRPAGEHLTDAISVKAVEVIRDAVSDGVPFFMNMAQFAVHTAIVGHPDYMDNYADGRPSIEQHYAAMIEPYDTSLGTILTALNDPDGNGDTSDNIADNTLIIFFSDNGGLSNHTRSTAGTVTLDDGTAVPYYRDKHNAPIRSGKGAAYEGGYRVPMIVAWAGQDPEAGPVQSRLAILPGTHSAEPVHADDLMPTILSIAGVPNPVQSSELDGQDVTAILKGEAFERDGGLYWHHPHQWYQDIGVGEGIEPFTAMRKGDWKLIYFYGDGYMDQSGYDPRFELYNLADDIGETNNLADSNTAKRDELITELRNWMTEVGAQTPVSKATGQPVPLPAIP